MFCELLVTRALFNQLKISYDEGAAVAELNHLNRYTYSYIKKNDVMYSGMLSYANEVSKVKLKRCLSNDVLSFEESVEFVLLNIIRAVLVRERTEQAANKLWGNSVNRDTVVGTLRNISNLLKYVGWEGFEEAAIKLSMGLVEQGFIKKKNITSVCTGTKKQIQTQIFLQLTVCIDHTIIENTVFTYSILPYRDCFGGSIGQCYLSYKKNIKYSVNKPNNNFNTCVTTKLNKQAVVLVNTGWFDFKNDTKVLLNHLLGDNSTEGTKTVGTGALNQINYYEKITWKLRDLSINKRENAKKTYRARIIFWDNVLFRVRLVKWFSLRMKLRAQIQLNYDYRQAFMLEERYKRRLSLLQKTTQLVILLNNKGIWNNIIYFQYFQDFRGRYYSYSLIHPIHNKIARAFISVAGMRIGERLDKKKFFYKIIKTEYYFKIVINSLMITDYELSLGCKQNLHKSTRFILITLYLELGKTKKNKLISSTGTSLVKFVRCGISVYIENAKKPLIDILKKFSDVEEALMIKKYVKLINDWFISGEWTYFTTNRDSTASSFQFWALRLGVRKEKYLEYFNLSGSSWYDIYSVLIHDFLKKNPQFNKYRKTVLTRINLKRTVMTFNYNVTIRTSRAYFLKSIEESGVINNKLKISKNELILMHDEFFNYLSIYSFQTYFNANRECVLSKDIITIGNNKLDFRYKKISNSSKIKVYKFNGVRWKFSTKFQLNETNEAKTKKALPANLIHAMDADFAAFLLKTGKIISIHDSFICSIEDLPEMMDKANNYFKKRLLRKKKLFCIYFTLVYGVSMLLQIKDKKRLRVTFVSPREHFYFYSQDVIIHDKISWSVQSNGIKLVLGFSCATLIKIILEEFAKYIAIKNIVFQSLSYDNFGALEKATINWTDLRVTEANLTTDELGKTHAHYFINYVDKGLYKYIRTKHIAISKVHSI